MFRTTVGESPMVAQMRPESHARIVHVRLQAGGAALMGAEMQPNCGGESTGTSTEGTCVNVMLDTVEEAEHVWAKLAQAGPPSITNDLDTPGRNASARSISTWEDGANAIINAGGRQTLTQHANLLFSLDTQISGRQDARSQILIYLGAQLVS